MNRKELAGAIERSAQGRLLDQNMHNNRLYLEKVVYYTRLRIFSLSEFESTKYQCQKQIRQLSRKKFYIWLFQHSKSFMKRQSRRLANEIYLSTYKLYSPRKII